MDHETPPGREPQLDWAMPWLRISRLGAAAIAALDYPLITGEVGWCRLGEIDLAARYSPDWVREILNAGDRERWYVERVYLPVAEDDGYPEVVAEYEDAKRLVGGQMMVPGCLADYVRIGYDACSAALDGGPEESLDPAAWKAAMG